MALAYYMQENKVCETVDILLYPPYECTRGILWLSLEPFIINIAKRGYCIADVCVSVCLCVCCVMCAYTVACTMEARATWTI